MTIPTLLLKLKNCCKSSSGKSEATRTQPRFDTQSGFQTLTWNEVLFRELHLETAANNWLNCQGRNFYQSGLSKLVLRSDKWLNRFGDHVEK
ncbi:hypothetical protein AVEN_135578-1 [Araneus ventricosus]|uniref:Uncharacterized protein n=1 Tax=Araneus ventricosus TaxID=182803 RepID=A0A4Y2VGG3_ARAVE|nr:hypothetical protein AVEN_135578-1 [Araneus ventricosus]